jgi:hypothetical protein
MPVSYVGFAARFGSPACDLGDRLDIPQRRAGEFFIALDSLAVFKAGGSNYAKRLRSVLISSRYRLLSKP